MNLDRINQWLTLAANLGVIAGILFLAMEIGQNNALLEAQGRQARLNTYQANRLVILENPEISSSLLPEVCEDQSTYPIRRNYYQFVFSGWQFSFLEYQSGFIELQDLPLSSWSALANLTCQMREWWEDRGRQQYRADFVQFMDEMVFGGTGVNSQ